MYNVLLFNRTTKTYSRIDFENKDAKAAWKLYSHWRRKYLYEYYWIVLCKNEYVKDAGIPVFNLWNNLNFGPILKRIENERIKEAFNSGNTHAAGIKSTKPNIEPLGGAKN